MGKAETDPSTESDAGFDIGRWPLWNLVIIALFFLLTLFGIGLTIGVVPRAYLAGTGSGNGPGVIIPGAVFLYSGLGALGYVFTKLMTSLEEYDEWGDIENLAEMLMRIPAAWLLAVGVYHLGSFALGSTPLESSQLVTGLPFLAGLYVNVTYKWFGGLADRLLGRQPDSDAWGSPQARGRETDSRPSDSSESAGGGD